MIYEVRQMTTYDYQAPVPFSRHVARLTPVDRPGQRVISTELIILPKPSEVSETRDFFGNLMTGFALYDPHSQLTVELRARVEVDPPEPLLQNLSPAWEGLCDAALESDELDADAPCHMMFPSRSIQLDPAMTAYVAASFTAKRPVVEAALDVAKRIKKDFAYKPGATDASTAPGEAFRRRLGVCQDFAQIMIAGLRGLGLPAAYISGYLRTDPPPGRPRLEGADATHAWVAVWCGEATGWIGVDPTNGIMAGEDHVILARGRDYADVSPLDGVIIASAGHGLTVEVDVVPVK